MSPKSLQNSDFTVVYDLDGTLVDTAPDLLEALNHTVKALTDEQLSLGHARNMIGHGAEALILEALAHLDMKREDVDLSALLERFLAYYLENISVHSRAFPGLEAHLDRMDRQGANLAVCTNKLENPSRKLLTDLELHDRFKVIVGRDTLGHRKPDPRTLLKTIAMAGGTPRRSVFVGDSITDADTAKAAGVPCVLVSFGYTVDPVESLGADHIIDHYDELEAAVAALLR